jgi:hypothetical protein
VSSGPDLGFTEDTATEVNNLGTEFGKQACDAVQRVHFVAATRAPCGVAVIYYDDKAGLERRGINVSKKKRRTSALPQPFRGDQGCRPPDGWRP